MSSILSRLTFQQREFMRALQEALAENCQPVCVDQIRIKLKKSDSRVRSHIKVLMRAGYVCCVGRSRVKRYVPSMLWLEEIDDEEVYAAIRGACVGGICENPLCQHYAEDYYAGRYLCRDCIMGYSEEEDQRRLRQDWECGLSSKSSAGMLSEHGYAPPSQSPPKQRDRHYEQRRVKRPAKRGAARVRIVAVAK